MRSSKILDALHQRRDELVAIDSSRANWSKVARWHTRTRPVIAQFFPQQLVAFDALGVPRWVAYPRTMATSVLPSKRRVQAGGFYDTAHKTS